MCSSPKVTSLLRKMHEEGEKERCSDCMYQMLVSNNCPTRSQLAHGIVNMLDEMTTHPVLSDVKKCLKDEHLRCNLERALLVAALSFEPNFTEHVFSMPNICRSTMSQFLVTVVQPQTEQYLNGGMTLVEFVNHLTHAYITL